MRISELTDRIDEIYGHKTNFAVIHVDEAGPALRICYVKEGLDAFLPIRTLDGRMFVRIKDAWIKTADETEKIKYTESLTKAAAGWGNRDWWIEIESDGLKRDLKHKLTERAEGYVRDIEEALGCENFDMIEHTAYILQRNAKLLKNLKGEKNGNQ